MRPFHVRHRSSILIVQSDPDICEVLRDMLEADGYQVDTANSGKDGMGSIRERSYGAVLLDVRLPDVDGLAVFQQACMFDPLLPVVALTGFKRTDTIRAALKAGAFAYMVMPYAVPEMKALVRQALAVRELLAWIDGNQACCRIPSNVLEAVEAIREAMVITDQEGDILFSSRSAERLFSCRQGEMIGRRFGSFLGPPYCDSQPCALVTEIQHERNSFRQVVQLPGKRRDGTLFPLRGSLSRWNIKHGTVYSFVMPYDAETCGDMCSMPGRLESAAPLLTVHDGI